MHWSRKMSCNQFQRYPISFLGDVVKFFGVLKVFLWQTFSAILSHPLQQEWVVFLALFGRIKLNNSFAMSQAS